MSKKLILITVAALGILYSECSMAKVCRLGDTSCDTNGFYGVGDGECDSSFKTCSNPRVGATFCYAGEEAKYKDSDCCATLVANEGYQNCSIDDALVGYGKSCKGAADNITYWQYCGCTYGFVEVDGTNTAKEDELLDENNDPIRNLDGNLVPYEARCGFDTKLYGGKCRFAQCNADRHFFFDNTGDYCKYREETRCGGFGCMQVYDCNHDEINTGKEYYRNDSEQLAPGLDNFIPYLSEDQLSNERDVDGTIQLIKTLNSTGTGLVTEDYNLTNKIVCSYAQSDGTGNDTGTGLNCNDVPNYCYLWTGCNNVRKWYNNHVNEGVIYDSEEAYLKWMSTVEKQSGYNYTATYAKNNPYHDAFYADINPGYGVYTKTGNTYNAVNGSSCIKGIGCRITSANNGCTYITTNCHQDDAQHQCWKKISCSEENRFYSSFINASNVDNGTGKHELYLSSLNAPYWDEFYAGLLDKEIYPACLYEINECNDASGCYKKIGCETGFEDIRDHEEIENDWYLWFGEIRALCNDATRCYRATSCEASVGAYSSRPNTSFFVTISSTATGLTCFRGQECYVDAGAYTSVPNTSFFVTITSSASGSTCYRGQNCYIAGGSYTSSPNTQWFFVESSIASGSTCYRGWGCKDLDNGAYSSEPNTSFFYTVNSFASGSGCYRGSSCNIEAGAYSSTPNTSFFITISSSATGSTAYRGQEAHIAAGAYSSTPNTSFFNTIKSLASGSTSYRGESVATTVGAYTSTPNTSFFIVISSSASGSTAYRGEKAHIAAGAYSSTPNTSFFNTISSIASGSTSYRGESVATTVGAYTSTPNTSFFFVISSSASGSTAYRGEKAHTAAGAYSSTPNTSFFNTISSIASGSTSYRGESVATAVGAYTSTPNTSFFFVISSSASGSISYRGEKAHLAAGAYSSAPNTSFFVTIKSISSGSTAYRAESVREGAYATAPNTSFFHIISSSASGSTAYRADRAHIEVGAYSSSPNTSFFNVISSIASGSTAYRGESSATAAGAYTSTPNTSFFITVKSLASGSTSYRATIANTAAGSYTSSPNETYFVVHKSLASGSTCYRGAKCAETSAVVTNTSFFITTASSASGSTCYRAQGGCRINAGAYSSEPNTAFFNVLTSTNAKLDSTCYRGGSCATLRGAYSSYPNTSFFYTVHSYASGSTCYRASGSTTSTACRFNAGAYAAAPNTTFFNVISSTASGITCYRGQSCATTNGTYTSVPNTSFFNTVHSLASSSKCYRGTGCRFNAGAYTTAPNTAFFDTISSAATGITCYRGQNCAFSRGAYASTPNTNFFHTVVSYASGSTCYRATGCVYSPNSCIFNTVSSIATGQTCYRASTCKGNPDAQYFNTSNSSSNGVTCSYATSAKCSASNPTYFTYASTSTNITSDCGSITATYPTGCVGTGVACDTKPAEDSYFESEGDAYTEVTTEGCGHSQTCYVPTNSGTTCKYTATCDSTYFTCGTPQSWCGKTCYNPTGCATGYANTYPNTDYFTVTASKSTKNSSGDLNCYKGDCRYSNIANYFTTISSTWNGKTCYIAERCNIAACSYGNKPYTYYSYISTSQNGVSCNVVSDCAGSGSYNKSYADTTISGTNGKSYRYGDVFVETTTREAGVDCGTTNCYIGCSCNTSNGWYASCQGTDCQSVTDTRYTGVNSLSASGAVEGGILGKSGLSTQSSTKGNTQIISLDSGISTMSGSATTCYKTKTCEEGGYYSAAPSGQTCEKINYNGSTCYTDCKNSSYGFTLTVACGGRLMVSVELKNDDTGDIIADYSYVQCNVGNNVSTDEEHFFKGNIIKTYQLPAGKYTASVHTYYYYPNAGASSGHACQNPGSKIASKTVTVPDSIGVTLIAPACYGQNGGGGIIPSEPTCSDGGYYSSVPSGQTCDTVDYKGLKCYTNCKDNNYNFKVFTSGSSNFGTVTSMNTTVTLSGNGYNKSIKQSVNSASDIFSFTNLPSGTYTVEGTTTLRVKSGSGPATFCAHNSGSTSEVTKQVTIGSGGVSSVSLSFTCNNSSGGIIPSYTCSDGGYYSSVPSGQTCDTVDYKGLKCYTNCSDKTCSDYGYEASVPSGLTCSTVIPRSGLTCYTDCKDDYVCTCSVSADFVSVFNGKQIEVTVTCSDTNLSKSLEEIPFDVEGYVVNGGMGCNPMTNAPISVYIQPSVISWGKFTGRSAATFNSSCNDFRWYNKYIKIWQDNFAAQTKDGRLVRCIFR